MSEIEQYVQSYFGIPQVYLGDLTGMFQLTHLDREDWFVQVGEPCQKISFIKEGHIRIFRYEHDKDITQWISTQGEFVTDLSSFMFQNPARWYIQALTPCTLYTISKDNFNRIGELVPDWPELEKLFLAKCFLILEDRVFTFLSLSAEERVAHFLAYRKALFNEVPLHYIASMLGMTPETLSRIRKKLAS